MADGGVVLILFILISSVVSLGVNILFYRVVYKKKKRVRANTYTWLWTMGIILIVNAMLNGILLQNLEDVGIGGAIGLPLIMIFIITPFFTIVVPGIWAAIRAIYIKIASTKERSIADKTPESPHE